MTADKYFPMVEVWWERGPTNEMTIPVEEAGYGKPDVLVGTVSLSLIVER